MTTLSELANSQGVDKRTVQRWYAKASAKHGELGTLDNGVRILADDDVEKLLECASKRAKNSDEAEPCQIEIFNGVSSQQVDRPNLPSTINLAKFGSASSAIDLSTVKTVLNLTSQITQALDNDLAQKWDEHDETVEVLEELREARYELLCKTEAYRSETRVLSKLQRKNAERVKFELSKAQELDG